MHNAWSLVHPHYGGCPSVRLAGIQAGSLTIVSQKSSMVFTTFMNCSRSTGLVM